MYQIDPCLRNLVDVVPFGLTQAKPKHTKGAIKGVVPGIGAEDKILLWSGGIWDWFDPLTVIKAVERCHSRLPELRLFFMGMKSPNPVVDVMPMAVEARNLAERLNLLDKVVFFNETWVDYEDRANYLLEADAAVSAHFDTIETRFSFRTRILDNLWARLPILTTQGDQLAELIAAHKAGISLPYEDVGAWARAIEKVTSDRSFNTSCRESSGQLAQQFTWDKTAEPLLKFCRNPHRLPAYQKITMPSLMERAHAVYSRGGKDLVLRRSRELLNDMLP
jgi:glycosyltransferase involved in cell wall biosynthesis